MERSIVPALKLDHPDHDDDDDEYYDYDDVDYHDGHDECRPLINDGDYEGDIDFASLRSFHSKALMSRTPAAWCISSCEF